MKVALRTGSWIASALCWLLLSALAFFILLLIRDRARLIRDNDNERLLNMLFTSLRSYDDFGSAIEANPVLGERITGFGIYGEDLSPAYQWGAVPSRFDERLLEKHGHSRSGRYTIPDKRGKSVKFVLQTGNWPSFPPGSSKRNDRMGQSPPPAPPPPLPEQHHQGRMMTDPDRPPQPGQPGRFTQPAAPLREGDQNRMMIFRQGFGFFNTLSSGKYFYIDIAHPAYWRIITFTTVLFPLSSVIILLLILYIRNLYMRNREYLDRIEAQKNLVVLGTAASTLAHEIKNPLLSIRLQTGILEKIYPESDREELGIINEEVDRLAGLTFRINDYIRDAKGDPRGISSFEMLREISRRLCGRDIAVCDDPQNKMVFMDPDRFRSVLENLIRNALESGGAAEDVTALIGETAGKIRITVFDRGRGIAEADMKQVFDPFFTRKSTGTGIGLSICKRFVEAAGGVIFLENREGGGVAATVILPGYGANLPKYGG
ncbi:MAG: HAMP domain-containing histidine kinase [Spirochaetaceae bacterium]|jgi:two-component system sensor histidine kinase HydH|nr:HAMP domain-containing histidine kinase [Spirochaetaceae bacterium]